MKLSHKLMVVSAASLIGVSPVLSASQTAVVQAAHKSTAKKTSSTKKNASKKGTIKLSHNSYV